MSPPAQVRLLDKPHQMAYTVPTQCQCSIRRIAEPFAVRRATQTLTCSFEQQRWPLCARARRSSAPQNLTSRCVALAGATLLYIDSPFVSAVVCNTIGCIRSNVPCLRHAKASSHFRHIIGCLIGQVASWHPCKLRISTQNRQKMSCAGIWCSQEASGGE